MKQDVKWATSIYNDQTIRKYIFKILRKGYLLKKMEEMCNDFEKNKIQKRLQKYNQDLNTLVMVKDWQLLYTYDDEIGWTTDVDDSEYLSYFSSIWTVRASQATRLRQELRQNLEFEHLKTASFKVFQQLRMIVLDN